tara:strand:- start:840 stop:2024 length:1185 start_codon:yes stop_codon:yes gene_type:complete
MFFSALPIGFAHKTTVHAQVNDVGSIKTFTNAKGQGALFNVTLEDAQAGRVRGTMFSTPATAEKQRLVFVDALTKQTTLTLTKFEVRRPNPKFSKARVELQLNDRTEIRKSSTTFTRQPPQFTALGSLTAGSDIINVRAIATAVEDTRQLTTKNGETTMQKVILCDESNVAIKITCWAPTVEVAVGDVLECLNVRCSVFRDMLGLQTMRGSSKLAVVRHAPLENWWTSKPSIRHTLPMVLTNYTTAASIGAHKQPATSHGLFTVGKVSYDYWSYPADPSTGHKVVKRGDNWFNEKTQQWVEGAQHRYLMTLKLLDGTGSLRVTAFNDVLEQMMGRTCDDMMGLTKQEQFRALCELEFKEFACNIRTREDGEGEMRHTLMNAIDLHDEQSCLKYT